MQTVRLNPHCGACGFPFIKTTRSSPFTIWTLRRVRTVGEGVRGYRNFFCQRHERFPSIYMLLREPENAQSRSMEAFGVHVPAHTERRTRDNYLSKHFMDNIEHTRLYLFFANKKKKTAHCRQNKKEGETKRGAATTAEACTRGARQTKTTTCMKPLPLLRTVRAFGRSREKIQRWTIISSQEYSRMDERRRKRCIFLPLANLVGRG